ncbi:hypothetical protein BT96DRAFT_1105543, partial [Gymnopus androsaceus JB14]
EAPYFPWPDRETCVLDILRHIPRCAFSRKQNLAIHWAMVALGVPNLPSDRTMDDIDRELQKICGIQTHKYNGKLGHIYYVNDLAGIIAQEMSNKNVRPHLHFIPEETDGNLAEAYQAESWLKEKDPDLLTPVHSAGGQDFFTLEPVLLTDGKTVCMPSRWFKRHGSVLAKAWPMEVVDLEGDGVGWAVQTHREIEIAESDLLLCFQQLKESYQRFNLLNPSQIIANESSPDMYDSWTKTDPSVGNRWRHKSRGKRVVAFPIWLYCDDTSGNVSKKWNKHNSFLFTAAGLPRHLGSQETNVHFLCTSNTAPPLEMLDGIVEQLAKSQSEGIWAWDSQLNDLVLVIPSVLAMLGDNPMQSEFACHIGFRGRLFCRVCRVSGKAEDDDEADANGNDGNNSDASVASASSQKGKGRRKAAAESMKDMITRITDFMKRGVPRTREETCEVLRSQFVEASRVGGGAEFKRLKTKSGIKDTYQAVFIDRLQAIATKKGISKDEKEREMIKLKLSFPKYTTSPVWRIRDLNPHQDTPVEVLHVILLGAVKYFWRDSVNRTKNKKDQPILIARLSSFNTWGLGLSPLDGKTLVNYAGSLTGRDFRAIAQAAPFVLEGLITDDQLEVWKALSALVTLVWQPQIHDIDEYIVSLTSTIDYFLDCTCRLTPRWFNKPKFHVLLHLPSHIRRFGPAMLFATESFESYNAIIRARSVHSNRHAPSKDIAHSMARSNRVRHLLNGGAFWTKAAVDTDSTPASNPSHSKRDISIYERLSEDPLQFTESIFWRSASKEALDLLKILNFDAKLLGRGNDTEADDGGLTYGGPSMGTSSNCRTYSSVVLQSGDEALIHNWVVWDRSIGETTIPTVGLIVEIVQGVGSAAEHKGLASFLTICRAITGEWHPRYGMRQIELTTEHLLVRPEDVRCVVNIQHNCCDNKCPVTRTATVMKEREESKEKELRVQHINSASLVLNSAQMRSAAYLKPFRRNITPLNREEIIRNSVRIEIDARKQKANAESKASAPPPKKITPAITAQRQASSSRLHNIIPGSSQPLTSYQNPHAIIRPAASNHHPSIPVPPLHIAEQQLIAQSHSGHYRHGASGLSLQHTMEQWPHSHSGSSHEHSGLQGPPTQWYPSYDASMDDHSPSSPNVSSFGLQHNPHFYRSVSDATYTETQTHRSQNAHDPANNTYLPQQNDAVYYPHSMYPFH